MRWRLTALAREDIATILDRSHDQFGSAARRRYERLIAQALHAKSPIQNKGKARKARGEQLVINFDSLLEDNGEKAVNPREIFLTLPRSERFTFLRDVQGEVLQAWFEARTRKDTVVKLNVGSGKTVVGLLALQSSLNEGIGPAVYVAPDKLLVAQVLEEGLALGLDLTDNENDTEFLTREKILVVNIHKLFNGRSVFGVGGQGERISVGSIVIDDAHACLAAIRDQFRVCVPTSHPVYPALLGLFEDALRQQSPPALLDIKSGDPQKYIEVPFWTWQEKRVEVLQVLHSQKTTEELRFRFDLIANILPNCRCIVGGRELEIAPTCIPTDVVRSFASAQRRIYMTATLPDDSVLVTDFGAEPNDLATAITPASAQDMGERMILMPQELNPELSFDAIKPFLAELAQSYNVVVLVPSARAAEGWSKVAAQVLKGDNVANGVDRLRKEHVGLTVLVNRYDGIDLPKDACRVLAIAELPEVASLIERADMSVLGGSRVGLRRQIQRIEQGMGRGVRSNEDYCVVLLLGSKLTRRLLSPDGRSMLTGATRAQLDLSKRLARQIQGSGLPAMKEAIENCLQRNRAWITASKKALLAAGRPEGVGLDASQLSLRESFDLVRMGDYPRAAAALQIGVNNVSGDSALVGWLKARLAEATNFFDRNAAQQIIRSAYQLSPGVTRPIEGVSYQKISASTSGQAAAVASFFSNRFLEQPERLLFVQELVEALRFEPDTSDVFEGAVRDVGAMLGLNTQRPEKDFREEGPDNLWALRGGSFLVIECKNGSVSQQGISKTEVGQLSYAMEWFRGRYGQDAEGRPVIIHPLSRLAPDIVPVRDMRVIDPDKLNQLKLALRGLAGELCVDGVLGDLNRVKAALISFKLTEGQFVETFTKRV